jgi:hypothetical protein
MVGLPVVMLGLFFSCGKEFCVSDLGTAHEFPGKLWAGVLTESLLSSNAVLVVFGWCAACTLPTCALLP